MKGDWAFFQHIEDQTLRPLSPYKSCFSPQIEETGVSYIPVYFNVFFRVGLSPYGHKP